MIYKKLEINEHPKGGYLLEAWRPDWDEFLHRPEMMYLSYVPSGETRGPHEHKYQTDYFIFTDPGMFDINLWESGKPDNKRLFCFGGHNPHMLIVPPGVVHGYKNVSKILGLVINLPNMLYKGKNKKFSEDIIRWENDPKNPYVI